MVQMAKENPPMVKKFDRFERARLAASGSRFSSLCVLLPRRDIQFAMPHNS